MSQTDDSLELRNLSEKNFEEFSTFLNCQDSGCYCSFWHQKFSSMDEWHERKKKSPELNKSCMLEKVRSKFHLGVLVYRKNELVAWISVGPFVDFYWAWKRVAQLGDAAKNIAGILCITRKTTARDSLPESELLKYLMPYAKTQGWTSVEGYPFDRAALDKHGSAVAWAGFPEDFQKAGFKRIADHWLNSGDYPRSIYEMQLT